MIIPSLLDTDFYKFTMGQYVFHRFSNAMTEFKFKCRNVANFSGIVDEIKEEVQHLCSLSFNDNELDFLKTIRFLKQDYIEFLRTFRLNPDFIFIWNQGNDLHINIRGPWFSTIYFEVPVLAIVNEVYYSHRDTKPEIGIEKLEEKIELIKQCNEREPDLHFKFADFGTRRRFSHDWHRVALQTVVQEIPQNFVGTSNVLFSYMLGKSPIGTMAHETFQASQAYVRLIDSIKFTLENWVQEYRGDLGIALTDNITMDAFLRDFDLYFAKLFDGCRHDSADPYTWCEKLINHYKTLKIDPMTKTAVFSDGLTFPKAIDLTRAFKDRIRVSTCIGTNFTNDCGLEPLQIVIKMIKCNGQPVAKISDNQSKIMCEDTAFVDYLKHVFKVIV